MSKGLEWRLPFCALMVGMCLSVAFGISAATAGESVYTYDQIGRVITVTNPNGSVITYVYDAAGNRTATQTLANVSSGAPIANWSSATVLEGSTGNALPLNIGGGTASTVAVTTQGLNGTATSSGASITYTPNAGFTGTDTIQYTAHNSYGTSAPATVSISVSNTSTKIIILSSTSSTTWTVPSDWNNASNSIEAIGGGGGGGAAPSYYGTGGGGGGYSKITNVTLTPGALIGTVVGVGGIGGSTVTGAQIAPYKYPSGGIGGDTFVCTGSVNCSSITGSAVIVGAKGGSGGYVAPAPDGAAGALGGQSSAGIGSTKYSGGYSTLPAGPYPLNSAGGGAAGPSGNGGNGQQGAGSLSGGGGGGGADGGANGVAGSGSHGGAGGAGAHGGGSGGTGGAPAAAGAGLSGGSGTEWDASHGAGGGGGSSSVSNTASPGGANGGLYGGGGGGGNQITGTAYAGGNGGQGLIVIKYLGLGAGVPPIVGPVTAVVGYNTASNLITLNLSGGVATSVSVAHAPAHGSTSISGTTISYSPTAGYAGSDSFQYAATNANGSSGVANVNITVSLQPPAAGPSSTTVLYNSANNPIALNLAGGAPTGLSWVATPIHGTALISGTSITYSPATNYAGPDSFQYSAFNGAGTSSPATVSITVAPPAPVAGAVSAWIAENSVGNPVMLSLSGGAPAMLNIVSAPSHGSAAVAIYGNSTWIVYTPTAGYIGTDAFQYSATNASGTSAAATVTATISAVGIWTATTTPCTANCWGTLVW